MFVAFKVYMSYSAKIALVERASVTDNRQINDSNVWKTGNETSASILRSIQPKILAVSPLAT